MQNVNFITGIIGILWASLFHYHGYRDVTISEISEHRKEMAGRLNLGFPSIHPAILSAQYEESVKKGDETWGFDAIVDCTGKTFSFFLYKLLFKTAYCT